MCSYFMRALKVSVVSQPKYRLVEFSAHKWAMFSFRKRCGPAWHTLEALESKSRINSER